MDHRNGTHPNDCPCEWCEDVNASVERHPANGWVSLPLDVVAEPEKGSVTEPQPPADWFWFCILVGFAALIIAAAMLFVPQRADAATWQQPYGGCKEAWQAPHSAGANECRAHGWHISSKFVVGPRGVVRHNMLPACRNEDGSGQAGACYWWDGDLALINDSRDRSHYVWDTSPLWWVKGWHWSTAQDRAHYGMRFDCIVRDTVNAQGEAVARCPGRGW